MITHTYFAPGRVNLIGEHIDYNGGQVLPIALSVGITAKVTYTNNSKIQISSKEQPDVLTIDLLNETYQKRPQQWMNYPLGVIQQLIPQINPYTAGFTAFLESNLPVGSGLSSSASIEVLIASILLQFDSARSRADKAFIAQICQKAENDFIGVQCGIMDQFAVALSKANHAMLLNCQNLHYNYVTFAPSNCMLVVMNTNKPRTLANSKYNERKAECNQALQEIQKHQNIDYLCQTDFHWLAYIKDDILRRRAKHVITEHYRVTSAVNALKNQDWFNFGELLTQSHQSLKDYFEVTGFELDTVVTAAINLPGCYGARMTGAGFGGCAIALVETTKVNEFMNKVKASYDKKTGLSLQLFTTHAQNGVHLLQ